MKEKEVQITTIIGRGAECNGDFSADCSVRIDGTIQGNLTVSGMAIVGACGYINGNVNAQTVIIGGEVNGNVNAPVKVELTTTARVIGDITTGSIVIDEKAVFQGRIDMNQDPHSKRQRPNGRAVKASRKSAKAAIEEALREVEEADKVETEQLSTAERSAIPSGPNPAAQPVRETGEV